MRPLVKFPPSLLLLALCGLLPACGEEAPHGPRYPDTRVVQAADVLHGVRVEDPYRWLEDDTAPEVEIWDSEQTARLVDYLHGIREIDEISERVDVELALPGAPSLPQFRGNRRFFRDRPEDTAHPILYLADAEGRGQPHVLLDPNTWSEDGTGQLGRTFPSPNGRLLAYQRAPNGSENFAIHVRDIDGGKDLPDVIERAKFGSLAWHPDGKGFVYTRLPAPGEVPAGEEQYHRRVYWHRLGDPPAKDRPVAGRDRHELEWPTVFPSSDLEHTFVTWSRRDQHCDLYEVRWDGEAPDVRPLLVGHEGYTEIHATGDTYVLYTNWKAPRYALYRADAATVSDPDAWVPILPESDAVIESVHVVGARVVVHIRDDLVSRMQVMTLDGDVAGRIHLPPNGYVGGMASRAGTTQLYFYFTSYVQPRTLYMCDVASEERVLTVVSRQPTTVDASALVSERLEYASLDGTRIPLFVLRRRDVPLDGKAPTTLYGYGGFRSGMVPHFSRADALWVDLGGVAVVACIRGGDEYGEAWHDLGSRAHKQNSFDDFIAGADWLVESGRAARDRLAILGGSNGGLLVAACVNQRPDLCRAAVCMVPLTDMLRFHRFQYARIWTKEYGNPDVAEEFRWLRAYSPYHNVKDDAAYPAVLVTAGLHDGRVNALHARKIVARWQHATSSDRPILLYVDRASGHRPSAGGPLEMGMVMRLAFLRQELAGE